MRNIQGLEEEKFYLSDEKDYSRIYGIISHMANYVLFNQQDVSYEDYFYDTEDKFLEKNRASVRVRKLEDKQVLSIRYISSNALKEEKVREAYFDMPLEEDITTYRPAQLFLSTKINDIYARRLEIDLIRKIRDLKVFLVIYTDRTIFELKNNLEIKISVMFDRLTYQAKFTKDYDDSVKFVLQNYPDTVNLDAFKRFIKEVNRKVFIVNDNESKFDAGKRVLNFDRFNKKPIYEEEEEETSEDKKE